MTACVSQNKNILAVTGFSPREFSYMGKQPVTYVYDKIENEQVTSLTAVFYVTQKDCQKQGT